MKKVKMYSKLFNEQGCLSGQTVSRYIDRKLNSREMAEVRDHTGICDLCRSALEGAVHFKSGRKFASVISGMHNHRFSGIFHKVRRGKVRRNTGQSSLLASVILLTGILLILFFYREIRDKSIITHHQTLKSLPTNTDTTNMDRTTIHEPDVAGKLYHDTIKVKVTRK